MVTVIIIGTVFIIIIIIFHSSDISESLPFCASQSTQDGPDLVSFSIGSPMGACVSCTAVISAQQCQPPWTQHRAQPSGGLCSLLLFHQERWSLIPSISPKTNTTPSVWLSRCLWLLRMWLWLLPRRNGGSWAPARGPYTRRWCWRPAGSWSLWVRPLQLCHVGDLFPPSFYSLAPGCLIKKASSSPSILPTTSVLFGRTSFCLVSLSLSEGWARNRPYLWSQPKERDRK